MGQDEPGNWAHFYSALASVLGFTPWQETGLKIGVTQYDYSQIDEDILGKAYETYLAEKRKEKGIYYTPKYVTQFIVEEDKGNPIQRKGREAHHRLRRQAGLQGCNDIHGDTRPEEGGKRRPSRYPKQNGSSDR
ncbi:hypothetical protein E3E29_04305 [Thermococcus sp. Bubb.Bath]|nr:hypothetical protein [Thermococcus sp. Bubb.Bath]